jgi:hypothetical protein
MYPGFIAIGGDDPFVDPDSYATEVVNNARAHTYAAEAGLSWLHECEECDSASSVTPGAPFTSVVADPAPWYDPLNPDSEDFLGVVGIQVDGADSSTRQVNVTMSITGAGMMGRTYMAPRTLVVRALAIAKNECGLQYGLTWLRGRYNVTWNLCGGNVLTFFDCCPCVCEDDSGVPCWAENYGEFKNQPKCVTDTDGPDWPDVYTELRAGSPDTAVWPNWPTSYLQMETTPPGAMCWPQLYAGLENGPTGCPQPVSTIWWPDTYEEVIVGPPTDIVWCTWPQTYKRLRTGLPSWSCCLDACVAPYIRQYYNVRVSEGPIVLSRPSLYSCGAVAEIEFSIICGDPAAHSMENRAASVLIQHGSLITDSVSPPPAPSPYPTTIIVPDLPELPAASSWMRSEVILNRGEQVLSAIQPRFTVRARGETSGPVRLGLWAGDERLAGYTIPYVHERSAVFIDGTSAYAHVEGDTVTLPAFVRDWDGSWPRSVELPNGNYRLTVDQEPDHVVPLVVDVTTIGVG